MSTQSLSSSHSAHVRMELRVNGYVLDVAQLAPCYLILRQPIDHPPAHAEMRMTVDGHFSQWPVYLVDGIQQASSRVRLSPADRPGD